MEFVQTQKGGLALLTNGFRFLRIREGKQGNEFWRCAVKHCQARATTTNGGSLTTRGKHTHAPNPSKNKAEKIVCRMRKRTREEMETVPGIYDQEIQAVATEEDREAIVAHLPTLTSLKSSLYRNRRKKFPPLPQNRSEVNLQGEWSLTSTGEDFIVVHQEDIIFSTDSNLRRLASADTLYMDGTFEMCPSLFYQIFSIHIIVNGQQFPMVYCLLQSKSREMYNHTFTLIKESLQNIDLELNPDTVMSDFELALLQAIRINFPSASHKGCYYHFRQCIWRKVQSLGLQQQYQSDSKLRHAICKTAAIAFVLVSFAYVAWDGVVQELEEIEDLDDFKDYFESTWMRGQYPRIMWNYFSYDGPQTNNRLEGWHSRLKRIVKMPHPNIYEIVDVFKREQASVEVSIMQLEIGGNPPPRKKKYTENDKRIKTLKDRLDEGNISMAEFVSGIGQLVGL